MSNIHRVAVSLRGRSELKSRLPSAISKVPAILGWDPDSTDYLASALLGVRDLNEEMWPEVFKKVELARSKDWSKPVLLAKSPDEFEERTFGSFSSVYKELVQPWFGDYETLKKLVSKLKRGKVTREDGVLKLGRQGGDRRSKAARANQGYNNNNITLKRGTSASYTLARLARDRPDLLKRVQANELSANAAAIEAGWRKKPTPFERCKRLIERCNKLIPQLTPEERRRLRALLNRAICPATQR